jgi:tetratricopeptide (TPR) repeat protein
LFEPDVELTEDERNRRSRELQEAGNTYAEQERWPAALSAFEAAIGFSPMRAELFELKAQVYMALGNDTKAVVSAERALEIDPELVPGYVTLSRALVNTAQLDKALDTLQRARALRGDVQDAEVENDISEVRRLIDTREKLRDEKKKAKGSEDPMDLDDILSEVDKEFLITAHGDVDIVNEAAAVARLTRRQDNATFRRGFRDETPVQPNLSREEDSLVDANIIDNNNAILKMNNNNNVRQEEEEEDEEEEDGEEGERMDIDEEDFERNISAMSYGAQS